MRAPSLALACLALSCVLVASGCRKKRKVYKRSTPAEALSAFSAAIADGAMPGDLEFFVSNANEIATWRFRCKERGCKRADFKVVSVESEDDYAATYLVDFTVYGNTGLRVAQAARAPVKFVFLDGVWYIDQIGTYTRIPLSPPKDAGTPGTAGGG